MADCFYLGKNAKTILEFDDLWLPALEAPGRPWTWASGLMVRFFLLLTGPLSSTAALGAAEPQYLPRFFRTDDWLVLVHVGVHLLQQATIVWGSTETPKPLHCR